MTQPLTPKNFLEVDLAFTAYQSDQLTNGLDNETFNCLIKVDFWCLELKNWIQALRKLPSVICPKIIRENNLFSIGLVFTDNLSIQKMNAKWRDIDTPTDVLSFPVIDENIISPYDQFIELGLIIFLFTLLSNLLKILIINLYF